MLLLIGSCLDLDTLHFAICFGFLLFAFVLFRFFSVVSVEKRKLIMCSFALDTLHFAICFGFLLFAFCFVSLFFCGECGEKETDNV